MKLPLAALATVLAAGPAIAQVPTPALHFDFENVSGVTVPNLGSAGSAFDGTLTPIRTGPGFDNAVISTDSISGTGALQPTNLTETILGDDEGFYGGALRVPDFDLVPNRGEEDFLGFSFSAWIKLGSNPNQGASNGEAPNQGWQNSLMANENVFPPDGFKLTLNQFNADQRDGDGNRRIALEGGNGGTTGGQASAFDAVVDDGEYHHVAVVIDSDSSSFVIQTDFYVDGVLTSSTPTSLQNQFEIMNTDFFEGPLFFGAQDNVNQPFFAYGAMDDIMVWTNTALTAGDVAILATPPTSVAGDFNEDGRVDNGDLNLLLGNWGSSTVPPDWTNGFVGPTVDNGELNALLGDWGTGTGAAIPEPTALVLAAVALAAAGTRNVGGTRA